MAFITANSVAMPDPVSISIDDEIIWSADTGRNLDGTLIGDVIAKKKNISVKWEFLQESEMTKISQNMIAGFFPVAFRDEGGTLTITSYRGTLSKEQLGDIGDGSFWYRSATVDIIQK